jgi:hypothetical protein
MRTEIAGGNMLLRDPAKGESAIDVNCGWVGYDKHENQPPKVKNKKK